MSKLSILLTLRFIINYLVVSFADKIGIFRDIKFNQVPVEEYFHVIDELGRYANHHITSMQLKLIILLKFCMKTFSF